MARSKIYSYMYAPHESTSIEPIPAFHGRGNILFEHDQVLSPIVFGGSVVRACAIVPPGVWIKNVADANPEFTRNGWRTVEWRNQFPEVDAPVSHENTELGTVVDYLTTKPNSEELLVWTKMRVVRHIRDHIGLLRPIDGEQDKDITRRVVLARNSLRNLVVDSTAVFGEAWVKDTLGDWISLVAEDPRTVQLPPVIKRTVPRAAE